MPDNRNSTNDDTLLELGRQAAALEAVLDNGLDRRGVWGEDPREAEIDRLHDQIAALPARTLAGLAVKARRQAWAVGGDVTIADCSSAMTASIMRDLLAIDIG